MLTRRELLQAGGLALAGLAARRVAVAAPGPGAAPVVEIRMRSDARGEDVWFDPIGARIEPGQTVRWIMASPGNPHTTTAYHPRNANHSLRIPEAAEPWDSGFLVNPGDRFEVALTVEGVYDYFCLPHEAAGMVGRIVVGRPGGPGTQPLDYFVGRPGTRDWGRVPPAAQAVFPSIEVIVALGMVHRR
jgi:plastocyanin